jgi:hypothetical protein
VDATADPKKHEKVSQMHVQLAEEGAHVKWVKRLKN